jgi:cytochrome b pre-mRNA-processing protein 3
VPKHMRRVGEAFYGRNQAYEAALAAGDAEMLVAALSRNVFGEAQDLEKPTLGARQLAAYMQGTATRLAAQAGETVARGELDFPAPESIG